MELLLIIKIIIGLGVLVGLYAILRNLDIIKIILIYFKDNQNTHRHGHTYFQKWT